MALYLLTDLVEYTVAQLAASPSDTWSDIKISNSDPTKVQVKEAFDPDEFFAGNNQCVYVMPISSPPDLESSQGRDRVRKLVMNPTFAVAISVPIQKPDNPGLDVSSWANVKKVLDFRELVDIFVTQLPWGNLKHKLKSVTCELPVEAAVGRGWFLTVTEFEFEKAIC